MNNLDLKSSYHKHGHNQTKICVSGAAETGHCGIDALDKAKELGREIARQGAVLITGATTGFPFWAAMGVKEAGGFSIGFSPAASEREHVEVYKLPLDYMDLIVYTGFGYPGRDLLLTRSADAVICGCGRIGTIHEFVIAFEDGKTIGIYEGPWEMDSELKEIIAQSHRPNANIVFSADAKTLVADVISLVKKNKMGEYRPTTAPVPGAETM
ncbi:hypothetical protein A3G06_00795 [Candidatus Nomurabacteria bacterium RIFCSPLOWO2_12_FULL_46_14]|uniref:Protein containing YHS domain protein n=1 Tax=Candidatus Nomurabacteria bacterium RIFCSPLOWO2_12_FULL_46_14 TaxID=1801797 RepID=A0A1F6Y8U6_9BACT|nr:MAG: hypothetical protein A3G06_00795 [Candidatus Nomurabacteria bacterium RIFCSPLOWO2_12_FULL_46_14]